MGFNKNCTVCKGTGWMPKKGSPEDAETAKLFGLSVDELELQPCNADGNDMGCYQAENFNAEGYEVVQIFPSGFIQTISLTDTLEEAKKDIEEFPHHLRHHGRLEIKKLNKDGYSIFLGAENFGGDPEGKLAKALERARKKAKQPRKPLKIERLKAEKIDYSSWICPVEEEFDFGEGMEKYECGSTDYRIVKDSASPTGYTVECSSCRSDISYDHEPYLQAKEAYEEKERKRIKQRYGAETFEANFNDPENEDRFEEKLECSWCGEPYDETMIYDSFKGITIHRRCAESSNYGAESFRVENRSLAKKSWDTLNNVETAVGTVGLAHMIGLGAIIGGGFAFLKGRKSNSKTEQ